MSSNMLPQEFIDGFCNGVISNFQRLARKLQGDRNWPTSHQQITRHVQGKGWLSPKSIEMWEMVTEGKVRYEDLRAAYNNAHPKEGVTFDKGTHQDPPQYETRLKRPPDED